MSSTVICDALTLNLAVPVFADPLIENVTDPDEVAANVQTPDPLAATVTARFDQ